MYPRVVYSVSCAHLINHSSTHMCAAGNVCNACTSCDVYIVRSIMRSIERDINIIASYTVAVPHENHHGNNEKHCKNTSDL